MSSDSNDIESPLEIYEYWKSATETQYSRQQSVTNKSNHCVGCARNDRDNVCKPFFGYGCSDADILFLGEAPGGHRTGENLDIPQDKRVWKDFREVDDKNSSQYEKRTVPDALPDLSEADNYGSWSTFAEEFKYAYSKEVGEECGIYYTNSAKCSDIHSDEHVTRDLDASVEDLNTSGKETCINWLHKEIACIQPNAILIFNNSEVNQINKMFNYLNVGASSEYDDVFEDLLFDPEKDKNPIQTFTSTTYECPVLCSPHFTARNWGDIANLWKNYNYEMDDFGYPSRYEWDAGGGKKRLVASALAKAAVTSL